MKQYNQSYSNRKKTKQLGYQQRPATTAKPTPVALNIKKQLLASIYD
jgi:hypothetical protein